MPSSQQLEQQAFLSQGATAVIHGCSIRALGPSPGEDYTVAGWAPPTTLWIGIPSGALQWKDTKAQLLV